eukprot:scaffold19974_cov18-Prasinocladus_malaysianus.AAC.1
MHFIGVMQQCSLTLLSVIVRRIRCVLAVIALYSVYINTSELLGFISSIVASPTNTYQHMPTVLGASGKL